MKHIHPRREILAAPDAHHGAFDFSELEAWNLHPDAALDFSVNSNPFGPSPKVIEALRNVPLDRYPDRESLALRRALAAHLNADTAQIVVGNGTAELLLLLAMAFIRPADVALILAPSFSEYARVAGLMGARVVTLSAPEANDFRNDPAEVEAAFEKLNPRCVFICNPNNPTGASIPAGQIAGWAADFPKTLFVIDEAYVNFLATPDSVVSMGHENILTLRSMTKDYGLAGLRLGYAVGQPHITDALTRVRPAWNVNALAQAAGIAALADSAYLQETMTKLRAETVILREGLMALGLSPLSSELHYSLVKVGDALAFRQKLLARGIIVREGASFGLPAYVRIATRRPEHNQRLIEALR